MIKQIRESIDFDCNTEYFEEPIKLSAAEWKTAKIKQAHKDIAYHTKAYQEEVERTADRNEWLKALRDSLPKAAP